MDIYPDIFSGEEFSKLKSTRDQIDFILTKVQPLADFSRQVYEKANSNVTKRAKNSEKSKQFRATGMNYCRTGHYLGAIVMFKKAILSAPFPLENDSQINELSLSYASKSMAEFQMKDYSSSLLSAENSLEFYETNEMLLHRIHCLRLLKRYPESLQRTDQLIQRTQNKLVIDSNEMSVENLMAIRDYITKKMLENTEYDGSKPDNDIKQDIPRDSDQSETGLWLHPSCELKMTEKKGRHFLAKQFIPKYTTVLEERPLNTVEYGNCQLKVCLNCHKWIGNDIWPCIGCNEVVFCDKHCFNEAYSGFHEYECGFIGLLASYGYNFAHAYRIMTRVGIKTVYEIEDQNCSIDFNSYIQYETQLKCNPVTDDSDVDTIDSKMLKLDTKYHGFHSMLSHNEKRSHTYQLYQAIEVALLFDYSKQFDFVIEEDFQSFVTFVDIVMKNRNRVALNVFGWYEYVADKIPDRLKVQPSNRSATKPKIQVGSSFCTVAALFNHSCEPNLFWFFRNGTIKFKTIADINAGQEINITYGPTVFALHKLSLAERHFKMKNSYFFDCNCSACLRECKTVVCIACRQCSGPVVFCESLPIESCCLECGQVFKDPKQTMDRIISTSVLFNQMLNNLDHDYKIQTSVGAAKEALDQLIDLVYAKSQPLKKHILALIEELVDLGHSSTAVEYVKHFDNTLESEDKESEDLKNELIILTDCYFDYLSGHKVVDTKHYLLCFQLFAKLIDILKTHKKSLEQTSPEKQKTIKKIRSLLKAKKQELKILSEYYQSLAGQLI